MRLEYVPILAELMNANKYVTIVAYVMFVSGLPFLVSLSRQIRYVTVQFVPRWTAGDIANAVKLFISLRCTGFICQTALMDGEFEKVKEKLINIIEVNISARNEHVPEIERKIQHKADLPYKTMPGVMIKRMVLNAVLFMDTYVNKQGISNEYSPWELTSRWQLDSKNTVNTILDPTARRMMTLIPQ